MASSSILKRPRRFERIHEVVEPVEEYRHGGYHPVHFGDVYHDRYQINGKLGYGQYSTVWLASDRLKQVCVALKVLKADSSDEQVDLQIYHRINEEIKHPGRQHVVRLIDHFLLKGPNGTHLCLVLPLLGPSLEAHQHSQRRSYPTPIIREISTQVLQGLDFLHHHGVVHGGIPPYLADLQLGNILFALSNSDFDERRITASTQCPVVWLEGVQVDDSAPSYLATAQPIYPKSRTDIDINVAFDVQITDMGGATCPDIERSSVLPIGLRAPEVVRGERMTTAVDIWSLGCLTFELLTGQPLFLCCIGFARPIPKDDVIRQMDEILSIVNDQSKFVDYLRELRGADLSSEEAVVLAPLLRSMLERHPETRPLASALLRYPWLDRHRPE